MYEITGLSLKMIQVHDKVLYVGMGRIPPLLGSGLEQWLPVGIEDFEVSCSSVEKITQVSFHLPSSKCWTHQLLGASSPL